MDLHEINNISFSCSNLNGAKITSDFKIFGTTRREISLTEIPLSRFLLPARHPIGYIDEEN